jgi:polyphosphate kinase 2
MTKDRDDRDDIASRRGDDPHGDGSLPHPPKMDEHRYLKDLRALQVELVKVQGWVKATGERLVLVFEGRDTAGKGGTIQRFTEHINPRGARHVALSAPNTTEARQWYFQRYVGELPTGGEIVFFDRSWYNRAGVEHVMGFCTNEEYALFLRQAPDFERFLVESGIRLTKFWLAINKQEQARRLASRKDDPLKQWKLSTVDAQALAHWDDYTRASERIFAMTHTPAAPWTILNANDKRTGRINAIRHVLHGLDYPGKDRKVAKKPDPGIVGTPQEIFGQSGAG